MEKLLKITTAIFLSLSLTYCSSSDKAEEAYGDESYESSDTQMMDNESEEEASAPVEEQVAEDVVNEDSDDSPAEIDPPRNDAALDNDVAFGEPTDMPESSAAPEPEPEPAPQKSLASIGNSFKQGMYEFPQKCTMRAEPAKAANAAGTIRAGKKLWVEPFDEKWHRVYKKSGPVFISRECL